MNDLNIKPDIIGQLNNNGVIYEINSNDKLNDILNKTTNIVFIKKDKKYYSFLGYSIFDLLNNGFTYTDFSNINYTVSELIKGGFTSSQFNRAKYTPQILESEGIKYTDFSNIGFSIFDLKDAGFKQYDYTNTGYTPKYLESFGFKYTDFSNAGYSVFYLKDVGFNKTNFNNTGYTPQILESLDFQYTDFSNTGYSIYDLKTAGFKQPDYNKTGYTPKYLQARGFKYADFSNTEFSVFHLKDGGFNKTDYKNTGYTPQILKANNFKYTDFSNTGFSVYDLKNEGFNYIDFSNISCSVFDLENAGFKEFIFKSAGYTPQILKENGFKYIDFSNTDYTVYDLKNSGFNYIDFSNIECSVFDLKNAGFNYSHYVATEYTSRDLKNGGFKYTDFLSSGYFTIDLKIDGFKYIDFSNIDCSVFDLETSGFFKFINYSECGYTPKILESLGFKYTNFINADYDAKMLVRDGSFTKIDFSNTGFTLELLQKSPGGLNPLVMSQIEYTITDTSYVLYTPEYLKSLNSIKPTYKYYNYTPRDLKNSGFKYTDFSNADYYVYDLINSGFNYIDFSNIECSVFDLENSGLKIYSFFYVGYTPKILASLGFKYTNFLNVFNLGYKIIDLVTEGYFTKIDFSNTDFTVELLQQSPDGLNPVVMSDIGYTITDTSYVLYTPEYLKSLDSTKITYEYYNYTPFDLKNANFKYIDFSNAGYTVFDLKDAEFKKFDFSNIECSVFDLENGGFKLLDYLHIYYDVESLLSSGFTKTDFSNIECKVFNFSGIFKKADYIKAGYTVQDLQDPRGWYYYEGYNNISFLYGFSKRSDYEFAEYTPLDLYFGGVRRYSLPPPPGYSPPLFSHGFTDLGYSLQDLINSGLKPYLQTIGYSALEVYNAGFQKSDFDTAGYSLYDLLDILPGQQLLESGYSQQTINAYRTFIFQISTTTWDSSINQPHRYPINNIMYSFQDLSINEVSNLSSNITRVTIKWCNDISKDDYTGACFNDELSNSCYCDQSSNGFFDAHTNDGLSLNNYTIPYYKDPTFRILQFGGIPFARNSAINTVFYQGYQFGGSIDASFDSPRFLPNTSFYNAFANSTASNFQNTSSWNTYNIMDFRGAFQNASKFKGRIGKWNFYQIQGGYMENIISGTGYNPIQVSIFLQDLSNNPNFGQDISLGLIPNYYNNKQTINAINSLTNKRVSFIGNPIIPNVYDFSSNYIKFGYSSLIALLTDAKIAGFTVFDLSGYSITDLIISGYTIKDIDSLHKYTTKDYYNNGSTLAQLVDADYTAIDLSGYSNITGFQAKDYYQISYLNPDISSVFEITDLLIGGYSISDLNNLGYSVQQIAIEGSYSIFDFTKGGYLLSDLSGVVNSLGYEYNLNSILDYSANFLKQNNISAKSLKIIGYDILQIIELNYTLTDLYDASYSITEIQSSIQNKYSFSDLNYTAAGYSLSNLFDAEFQIINLSKYRPLPNILIQNNIKAVDFSNIGYDINTIVNVYHYGIKDLLNANFTLEQIYNTTSITKDFSFQIIDFSNAGINASQMRSLGYTALQLTGNKQTPIYSLSELISGGYIPPDLRTAGYSISDLSNANPNYKLTNYYGIIIRSSIEAPTEIGYTLQELVDAGYSLIDLYKELNGRYFLGFGKNILSSLIGLYPYDVLINSGFTASDLYIRYNIPLNILQKYDYTTTEISTINAYIDYNKNNGFITTDISQITLKMLYDASFTPSQLIARVISTKTDISNSLYDVNKYYTNINNISEIIDNYFNTVILNNDAIQPFSNFELVSQNAPFQYNYSTMLPFGDTIDFSGQYLNFSRFNRYDPLYYDQLNSFYSTAATNQGLIYLVNKNFGFFDISSQNFINYNKISVSDAGWLTYYNYDLTNNISTRLLTLRFFPFPVNKIVYTNTVVNNFGYNILEIIANGQDKNNISFQITIHIFDFGLITLCNGDGNQKIYNPGNLRYSHPDPDLLSNVTPDIKYYLPDMGYFYDYSLNSVFSKMYDILRIDLRNTVLDTNTGIYTTKGIRTVGYLAGELSEYYTLKQLSEGYPAISLRNIGYNAKQLYDISGSPYSPFTIASCYNINNEISDILNYQ